MLQMETVLLQINDKNAYKLIENLEALDLVKVLEKNIEPKKKLSERFAGSLKLTDAEYNNFQNSITEGRNEWNRNI